MLPTVGRIIHVKDPAYPDEPECQAALVTGVDYGARAIQPLIYVSIWSKLGAARASVLKQDSPNWHDPRECQYALYNRPSLTVDAAPNP